MPAALIWLIKGRDQPAVTAGYCFPRSFPESLGKGTFLGSVAANSGSQRRDTPSHRPLRAETQLVQRGLESFSQPT